MTGPKATFTDVDSRPIVTHLVSQNDFEYLAVDQLQDDGSAKRLMLLNMYDAKKLSHACEVFMQRTVARNFSDMGGHLSAQERADLFNDDDV